MTGCHWPTKLRKQAPWSQPPVGDRGGMMIVVTLLVMMVVLSSPLSRTVVMMVDRGDEDRLEDDDGC